MKRPVLGFLTGLFAVSLIAATVPTGVDAFLEDIDRRVSDLEARVSVLEESSTTTTGESTTTSTSPASTSTTVVDSTTTTTLLASTTTTQASTTTTEATTTTTLSSIDLSSDWIITEDQTRSGFTVDANGFQILIDGADIVWDDFVIRDAARVMWHNACGVANLTNGVISDAGVENDLGFYPLHWHLCGDTTRGSVIENVTVDGGQNHAFVPHGSNGITFLNDTAVNTVGEAFWWDRPGTNEDCDFIEFCTVDNSNDIIVENLVVDTVLRPEGVKGYRQAGVVLGAGSGNAIRNSTVSGVVGFEDCSAFEWPEFANGNRGGNVWVFENNHGTSDCHGIFVWQNDSRVHVVDGFTGGGIDHGAYKNLYHYQNVDVPYTRIVAVDWSMSDSHAGDVSIHNGNAEGEVTFTNVTIDSLQVKDAKDDSPMTLTIDGTNITCGDVEWVDAHPETRVVIDGEDC